MKQQVLQQRPWALQLGFARCWVVHKSGFPPLPPTLVVTPLLGPSLVFDLVFQMHGPLIKFFFYFFTTNFKRPLIIVYEFS
ncbi:hypothetical protein C7S20_05660 [Christiangramia fulva]|uniref:Uncharacterized protein n=1 Tax=Christiangramia fulva TaxID=2126553 RepID=A0A2R3Z3F3_9FLAO|nr:hypothetical protein C7S20_05660 [Christiangramia fulva]